MADESSNWFLAVGYDGEFADMAIDPSDSAPSIACRTCGRESYITLTSTEPALCPCGAVLLEIVARL